MRSRWTLWVAGLALLLLAGVAAALFWTGRREVTTSSSAAYAAYKEAVANENCFYFKEARVGYARALELDPTFAMAMLGLARGEVTSDPEQKLALIKRAAREEGRLTERERLHVEMQLAEAEKRRDDQMKAARELHQKYPDDVRSAMVLGSEQQIKGNPDQAIRIFEDLLAVDPNNASAYNQIGYYYGYRGEYDKAVENLTKYQFISPNNANPYDSLGENQAYSGRYNEAIENLNRALAVKADFAPAYQHLGVAYEGLGEYAKAIQSYEKAAEISDSDDTRGEFLTLAVRAAFIGGDRDAVRTEVERLSKVPVNPKNEYAVLRPAFIAALLDLSQGRPADAERRLTELRPKLEALWGTNQKAGKIPPTSKQHFAQWNFLMASALQSQGKIDAALKLYESNANPPNPYGDFEGRRWIMEARSKVAEIVARKGDLDRAEKLIAENRKWNPSWGPCRASETAVAELRRAKVLAAAK